MIVRGLVRRYGSSVYTDVEPYHPSCRNLGLPLVYGRGLAVKVMGAIQYVEDRMLDNFFPCGRNAAGACMGWMGCSSYATEYLAS